MKSEPTAAYKEAYSRNSAVEQSFSGSTSGKSPTRISAAGCLETRFGLLSPIDAEGSGLPVICPHRDVAGELVTADAATPEATDFDASLERSSARGSLYRQRSDLSHACTVSPASVGREAPSQPLIPADMTRTLR